MLPSRLVVVTYDSYRMSTRWLPDSLNACVLSIASVYGSGATCSHRVAIATCSAVFKFFITFEVNFGRNWKFRIRVPNAGHNRDRVTLVLCIFLVNWIMWDNSQILRLLESLCHTIALFSLRPLSLHFKPRRQSKNYMPLSTCFQNILSFVIWYCIHLLANYLYTIDRDARANKPVQDVWLANNC